VEEVEDVEEKGEWRLLLFVLFHQYGSVFIENLISWSS
jgi:hypothetical protein